MKTKLPRREVWINHERIKVLKIEAANQNRSLKSLLEKIINDKADELAKE